MAAIVQFQISSISLSAAAFLATVFASFCIGEVDIRELKCLICTRVVEEMQKNISSVDTKKIINVGGFRLDDSGNYSEKTVPYFKSEIYLTELMENICNKMDDYVRATFKSDGRLTVIPLVNAEGKMNPIMSEVDVVQDSDLNKSLKFYCETLLDDYDEAIVEAFSQKELDDMVTEVCADSLQLCSEKTIQTSRIISDEL